MPEMYFQPSIVIFADAAGKAIYDLLCSCGLFGRIHEPLKDAICFIYHDESEGAPIYTCRTAKDEEEQAEKISVLKDAILYLENKISLDKASEDYAIPTTIPTIYIIGTPEARFVVNDLRDKGIWNGDISCLFLCEPDDQQQVERYASDAGSDVQTPGKLER